MANMTLAEQDAYYKEIDAASQHTAYIVRHTKTNPPDPPHALTVQASIANAFRNNQVIIRLGRKPPHL